MTSDTRASAQAPAPKQIGKYEIRGEIGRGTCGVVYRGFDPFVARDVAIKVALQDPEARVQTPLAPLAPDRAFFAEARAAGMLQHPHIVSTYDAGVEGELSYIVMEYIDGETLLPLCRSKGPRAPLEQVIDITFKCAKALDYAHSKGVLHRDIKPSNIMLTHDGVPKVMDFSIAEITAMKKDQDESVMGSPLYMSPEQVRNFALGPTSDLYALGAVLYQMLTGLPMFRFTDVHSLFHEIKNTPAPRIETSRADVPKPLCDIVEKLLYKDPAQRFQNGQELAVALTRLFEQLRLAEKQVSRRESRDSLRRLHFFDGFSEEEIDEILSASTMLTFQPGDRIIEEGAIDNAFYLIAKGQAEVRKGSKRINLLDKGDCFGEIAFLTSAKRTATVTAVTTVLALKVNSTLMQKVSHDCQLRFYKVFTETLIYRLTVTSAKLSAAS